MNRKKYIIVLLLSVLGMLCMVGASVWIIADPVRVAPSWHAAIPKIYVNKTVEIAYGEPHTVADIKRRLVFLDEEGNDLTATVMEKRVTLLNIGNGAERIDSADSTSVEVGSTYTFSLDLGGLPEGYAFGGTYESYDETGFEGIERGKLDTVTLLLKYETVRLGDRFYTAEDALRRIPENAEEGSVETVAIVEHDTSFAAPASAAAAGYTDDERCYHVRGTLLIPYASSISYPPPEKDQQPDDGHFFVTDTGTGLIGTSAMTEVTEENCSDLAVRVNSKTFSKNYNFTDIPVDRESGPYATLTVPSGVSLSVTGRLVVNAVILASGANSTHINGGYYGGLEVKKGGEITFESGALFECMGFTWGEGRLIAKSGSEVLEPFNMPGWKGGTASLSVYGSGVFPLSQYTVSSLIAETVFEEGSDYKLRAFLGAAGMYMLAEVGFITADSGSFLQIADGTVTKKVDESDGKLYFYAEGKVSVNNLSLEVDLLGTDPTKIDTSTVDVPVPGHLEMVIRKGITTIPENVSLKMLPGAHVRVEQGAELIIQGKALSYGKENVVGTAAAADGETVDVHVAGGGAFSDGSKAYPTPDLLKVYRTAIDPGYTETSPARVVVNGKLTVAEGATVAAEIESDGGGVVNIAEELGVGEGKELAPHVVKEYGRYRYANTEGGDPVTGAYSVTLESRWWNGNRTTAPVHAGQSKYINGEWIGPSAYTVCYHLGGGTLEGAEDGEDVIVDVDVWLGQTNRILLRDPVWAHHVFEGWYLDEDHTQSVKGYAEVESEGRSDLYANWEVVTYTVYGAVEGEAEARLLGTWTCDGDPLVLGRPEDESFTFYGWYLSESATGEQIATIDEDTIGRVTRRDGEGKEVSLTLFGRFADAAQVTKVSFLYEKPAVFAGGDEASAYPDVKSVAVEDIPYGWTFERAGMPEDELHGCDLDLARQYYFAGWFLVTDGTETEITPDMEIAPDMVRGGEIEVVARWIQKYRLTITLASQNSSSATSGYAYRPGFELTVGETVIRESYESGAETADKTVHSKDYTFWFMPGSAFMLRFFYDGGANYPDVAETTVTTMDGEPFDGVIVEGSFGGDDFYTYLEAFDGNTFRRKSTLTHGKKE